MIISGLVVDNNALRPRQEKDMRPPAHLQLAAVLHQLACSLNGEVASDAATALEWPGVLTSCIEPACSAAALTAK